MMIAATIKMTFHITYTSDSLAERFGDGTLPDQNPNY
jgi:hypothetical protein